jgi:hypothetical protein
MSLTSVEGSMTIEPRVISLPSPSKPKASYQHEFPYGPEVSLEINDIAGCSGVPTPVNKTQTLESRPLSNPEWNSLSPGRGVDQMETIWEPYKNRYRVLAVCFTLFGNGMNDAANGALIESLEKYCDLCVLANFTDSP